jgi:membrane protease YdiL (CAAX protease family)
MFLICINLYHKEFKKDFKNLKKDKDFIKEIFKLYIGEVVVSICAGIVIFSIAPLVGGIDLTGSENNKLVASLLKSAPVFMIMGTVFMGPIYEEGIMRLGLKKGIKNKGVFAIVSGFIFGIMHVVDNRIFIFTLPLLGFLLDYIWENKDRLKRYLLSAASIITYICLILVIYYFRYNSLTSIVDVKNLLYGISYVAVGTYFATIYVKKNNIFYSIGTHMVVNTIATIFLFFI